MKSAQLILIVLITLSLTNCNPKLPDTYHMDKKYWDISDYSEAISQIKYRTPKEEGLPRLSDPLTAPVFSKLVDKANVSVVLSDEKLGLKHRNELAQKYFDFAQEIIKIYQILDIQDKFVYPIELVKAMEFGLHTQLLYFKVGNDAIIKDAIDPEDSGLKRTIISNQQIIANNFNNYLEFLRKEDAFSENALQEYSKLLEEYYPKLIINFPLANYSEIKSTALRVKEKVKNVDIKKSLDLIVKLIDEKK